MNRRKFLMQSLAGSFTLGIAVQGNTLVARTVKSLAEPPDVDWSPNLFLSLASDGTLSIIAHRSEMGTGITTALPMILADEMEADWERVMVVQGDADARYGDQNTDGSRSIRQFYKRMRQVGALAKHMLIEAAALQWDVPASECIANHHTVVHTKSKRRFLEFGELAVHAAKLEAPKPSGLKLKDASERKYVGKDIPIRNMGAILDGSAEFGMDIRLPGMKFAVIARCPALGGIATKWDEAAALAVPGVMQVVKVPFASAPFEFNALGGIAVIADNTWAAIQGREKLNVQWEDGEHADFDSDKHHQELIGSAAKPGKIVRKNGELSDKVEAGGQRVTASYSLPHLAHASMETPCATARMTKEGAEIWMTTQAPQGAQGRIADALGLGAKQVTIHITLLGGGFGRKSKPDFGVEAALLAREVGAPIQVVWTREDDIQHDYYHAASAMHFEANLDAQGKPTSWLQRSAFTPIGYTFNPAAKQGGAGEMGQGFTDIAYELDNLQVESCDANTHLRVGWLRSVCNIFHAFGVGCFTDELAAAAEADPMLYLLERIGFPRHVDLQAMGVSYGNYGSSLEESPIDTGRLRRVIFKAAIMSNWQEEYPLLPLRGGIKRGLGIAVHRSFLGYVANVVEVEISKNGELSIPNVYVAVDCGLAIHPDRIKAQMEGAVVFGTSLARWGEITGKDGRVMQSNFHDYRVARNSDAPANIEVAIIENEELPTGVGEIGVPPFAPALLNAIFAATGKRIRSLPLKNHDLLS